MNTLQCSDSLWENLLCNKDSRSKIYMFDTVQHTLALFDSVVQRLRKEQQEADAARDKAWKQLKVGVGHAELHDAH